MSQAEVTGTIETRALPNTVVFGFVKALAQELSSGRVDLPSVPEIVLKMQRALADENVSNEINLVAGFEFGPGSPQGKAIASWK